MPQQSDSNFVVRFGSTVSARSVRHLQSNISNERDQWWGEVRQEITKSAQALNCTHVLGYREQVTIYQYVCIFTATGTAVRVQDTTQHPALVNRMKRAQSKDHLEKKAEGKESKEKPGKHMSLGHSNSFLNKKPIEPAKHHSRDDMTKADNSLSKIRETKKPGQANNFSIKDL